MKTQELEFFYPGELIDDDLELVLAHKSPADETRNLVPAYIFDMRHVPSGERIGGISLRVGNTKHITHYAGHLGYGVNEAYRGHHYAARSCRLLLPLAKRHGINPVWITCNPDNWASRRTCELAGAVLAEIVDLPEHTDLYRNGERQKCRYRIDL
jgi:predicted acetyltransferase